jgi:hypothetical protein
MSRHEKQPGERESVELPVEPLDQREAAFVRLLAEAIVSDIKRGGAPAREPLDESDEEISATISCEVAVARKAEEEDAES